MVTRRNGMWPAWGQWRDDLEGQLSELIGRVSTVAPAIIGGGVFPAVNVWEDGDNLTVEAELPGLASQDLDISVVGNELTIHGKRETGAKEGLAFHRRERGTGSFSRLVRLPVEVDSSKVQASLRDGVLTVVLPKHEAAKPRKISVNTSGN